MKTLIILLMSLTILINADSIALGDNNNDQTVVIVKEGDTLWDLCETYLGDPFLWPKVWSINPQIENAHLIEPGDKIHFNTKSGEIKIQKVTEIDNKLNGDFGSSDDSSFSRSSTIVRTNFVEKKTNKIGVRNDAILSRKKFKESGTIYGSKKENILLTQNDEVYLKFKNLKNLKKGDKFHIFRVRKQITHPIRKEKFGYLIDILGEVTIIGKTSSRAIGKINRAYTEIERGDLVLPRIDLSLTIQKRVSKKRIDGYIIEAFKNNDNLGSSELVFIDKGKEDGVEKGMHFYVVRHRDPISNKVVPNFIVGEIVVMNTTKETATSFIYNAKMEIKRGDIITSVNPRSKEEIKVLEHTVDKVGETNLKNIENNQKDNMINKVKEEQ